MLKQRVVSVLIVKGGHVVQSIGFKRYLPVGTPAVAVEYMNRWGIDEIVMLFIDKKSQGAAEEILKSCVAHCQVPLAAGGGVRNVEDIERLISVGADKVVVNTALISNPGIVTQASRLFGSQAIVASIDAKRDTTGQYSAMIENGTVESGYCPQGLAQRAEALGAGEILLNSIDNDGAKTGYDKELANRVQKDVTIPIILCGGVGSADHLLEGLEMKLSGVAAANFFHFTEHSVILAKRYLLMCGRDIRLDTYAGYENVTFDADNRVAKGSEEFLTKLKFQYIPEEVI